MYIYRIGIMPFFSEWVKNLLKCALDWYHLTQFNILLVFFCLKEILLWFWILYKLNSWIVIEWNYIHIH